jgi:hypothetical protein
MSITNNDDIDPEIVERMAAIFDDEPQPPRPKLPQARRYFRAAQSGFDEMVEQRHVGTAFIFHIIGVLTILRSVPFALNSVDRRLSDVHRAIIDEWWHRTSTAPEIKLIKRLRDVALKDAALRSIAVASSTRIGEGPTSIELSRDYDVDHIDETDQRRDLLADLRVLFDWFDAQLGDIEARLPINHRAAPLADP